MKVTMMELQETHDALIAHMPEGVVHDAASCPLCSSSNEEVSNSAKTTIDTEGGDIVSTYTKEELDAAIADATAPLQAELTELRATKEAVEVEARIEELNTKHAAEIAELQAKVDSAVLEAEAAKTQYAELTEMLEAAEREAEVAALFAAVREERVAQVKEVASFPEDHIEARADGWAAMEQESFDALVSDWKAIMTSSKEEVSEEASEELAETAMTASHDGSDVVDVKSTMREVMGLHARGIDPRQIH